jgi:hypothetical protein
MNTTGNMVKLLTGILLFLGASFSVTAQDNSNKADTLQEASIDDLVVMPMRIPALSEVGGSPFLSPDYKNGLIQISNDKKVSDVPVKFNILSNAIMVQKDGQEMKLESFYLVSYTETGNDGGVKHVQFRQGLPEVDNHTANSVYLVITAGPKVQLLKYLSQKVEDAATLGDYSRKELVITEQLYVYTPGGTIKRIKSGKKDLVEALPAMASRIEEIATANNLKLKSETEIAQLVQALNKP